jgi:6-phosphogluconolactonase
MISPKSPSVRRLVLFMIAAGWAAGIVPSSQRAGEAAEAEGLLVYVGTYTRGDSRGIYIYRMDAASGALTPAGVAENVENPSFLAIHPNRRFLYAVNEVGNFQGEQSGAVTAFAIETGTGRLTPLNQQLSKGGAPCHLVVDATGKFVLVANYSGGNVAALPIQADGRLGAASGFVQHTGSSVNPRRQMAPHAHSINLDRANRFAVAADLGIDKVLVYRFDAEQGTLTAHDPASASVAPGAGPRHFAFHPGGRHAYVINELNSTVTAFGYDPERGTLDELQTLTTLPEGFSGNNSTAEVQVHPSGKFLYGSNRGHDSLAIYRIDAATGKLTPAGHRATGGKTPRNFGIAPSGKFLLAANQNSNSLHVFRIDAETGDLQPTGHVIEVPSPVCVKFLSDDR